MEKKPTKKIILDEALTLFSKKGYEAISVEQIAQAVGIKAPSLYKHYKSKQDIFNAILEEMATRYDKQTNSMEMNGLDALADVKMFTSISEEMLIEMGKNLFLYFLHDEYVSKFRKMLTIEQYHNHELATLYTKQYVDDPLSYQGAILKMIFQTQSVDMEVMVLHFYTPLYFLLTVCDRHPERETEALQLLEKHIHQFNLLYQK